MKHDRVVWIPEPLQTPVCEAHQRPPICHSVYVVYASEGDAFALNIWRTECYHNYAIMISLEGQTLARFGEVIALQASRGSHPR